MPEIGERRKSKDIFGGTNSHYYAWIPCIECNKPRWVSVSKNKPSLRCFRCSRKHGTNPRKGIMKLCPICNKEFYVSRKQIYCSKECASKGMKEGSTLICIVCGKEYYRPPSQIKWRGSSCCSLKCRGIITGLRQQGSLNWQWKGGITPEFHRIRVSQQWKIWRKAVFERDNYTCQDCGKRNGKGIHVVLHPHHIQSFTQYPELRFEVSNGITVCKDCHKIRTKWQALAQLLRAKDKKKTVLDVIKM